MLSDEENERRRKLQCRARKLAALGKPQRVLPHEYEQGMTIIRKAHASGMSLTQIADQLELAKSTIGKLWAGDAKTMHRTTYERLLRLQPELPERTGGTRRGGAKLDPKITSRKLQALTAAGWTSRSMAPFIGVDQRNLSNLVLCKVKFVYAVTAMEIGEAYDKLQFMDPVTEGGTAPGSAKQARNRAVSHGWAPPWAWDPDTIDDPAAEPEWTGACGSEEGYRIHIRETIFNGNPLPLCARCRAVVETRDPAKAPKIIFNRERYTEAMRSSPLTATEIAARVFPDKNPQAARDTLYRWRDGSRRPRYMGHVEVLAEVLDLRLDELLDMQAMQEEAERPVVGHGQFNPYVLRAALDIAGLSFTKAANLPGSKVSEASLNKWSKGEMTPTDPDKLRFLAKHFGVPVTVFYS